MAGVRDISDEEKIVELERETPRNTWTTATTPESPISPLVPKPRARKPKTNIESPRGERPPRHPPRRNVERQDENVDDIQTVVSDGEGDRHGTVSSHSDIEKPKSSRSVKKNKTRDDHQHLSPTLFRTRADSYSSGQQDQGQQERYSHSDKFVNLMDLPKLVRVEPNSRGQFVTSAYKYDKPLSGIRIRVRLLKYPSLTQRTEWPGELLVLEDRIFCWQEKIYNKQEADFYMSKRNIVTDADEEKHRELVNNPRVVGKYFHSYVQSDFISNSMEFHVPVVRRCANKHTRKITKLAGNVLDAKLVNSDGESIVDDANFEDVDYERSIIPTTAADCANFRSSFRKTFTRKSNLTSKSNLDLIDPTIANQLKQTLTSDARRREEETAKAKEETRQKEGQFLEERREKASAKSKTKDSKKTKTKEEGNENEYVKRWVGSQRPSAAVSAKRKPLQQSEMSPRGMATDSEKPGPSSRRGKKNQPISRNRDSVEEILEPRVLAEQSKVTTGGPKNSSDNENHEQSREVSPRKKSVVKTINGRYRPRSRSSWSCWRQRQDPNSIFKTFRKQSQSMYIMATIPHMTRRKRNVIVCSIQTLPKAGTLLLKPDFGYRVIEAKRNQVFRLSWELFQPLREDKEGDEIDNFAADKKYKPKYEYPENIITKEVPVIEQIGDMFEVVSAREMRLVVMGEILSAQDFQIGPVCVHYVMEVPKGWRNESVSSQLAGITHSCYNNSEGVAHFSHHFYCQLAFSMDSVDEDEAYPRPMLIFVVLAYISPFQIRHEGYAYVPIPTQPGHHEIKIQTWRPAPRTTREKMLDVFLNITPALQDIRAVHIPINENEECRRANKLGLNTIPSGSIKLRLHVIHQTHSTDSGQLDKLDLLEKMSSATILKSVQNVITAFHKARERAARAKENSTTSLFPEI